MSADMKKMGELFRSKREEMNLSLKEVENATSIRMNYLQAIEEGQIDKFLSSVYVIGFVKQYATFLGFNGEKLIQDNSKSLKFREEKQEFDYGIGTLEQRSSPSGGVKWLPNLLWISISLVALIIAWYLAKLLKIF